MSGHDQHRAHYDENGDIVIPGEVIREPLKIEKSPALSPKKEPVLSSVKSVEKELDHILQDVRTSAAELSQELLTEGRRQYAWSFASAGAAAANLRESLKQISRRIWAFVTQPVIIPRRRKPPKEQSRLTLFFLDIVRFGGTFAFLFVALFTAMNYQSFWEIARSNMEPLKGVGEISGIVSEMDANMREKLLRSPSLAVAGESDGNLLGYLPMVGPPENRMIIPKLDLNVPLVTPAVQALLDEDWEALEGDIQKSLELGIVHYPGTARPGQAGNFFVTGHSSYYPWAPGIYKTVFARLHQLEPGDEYWVYYGGDKHRYIVREKKEVKPTDVSVLDQPIDRRVATLMTCTPVGTTLRRLIIEAEEVDPETGIALAVGEKPKNELPQTRPAQLPI